MASNITNSSFGPVENPWKSSKFPEKTFGIQAGHPVDLPLQLPQEWPWPQRVQIQGAQPASQEASVVSSVSNQHTVAVHGGVLSAFASSLDQAGIFARNCKRFSLNDSLEQFPDLMKKIPHLPRT